MNYTTPEDFIEEMRQALSSGNHTKAEQLSIQAIKHYPDNEDIKKCAYILAPAKATVSKRNDIDREGLKKSREWVNQQRINRKYLNQWVAVQNGKLLAAANSIDELFERVSDTKNVLFTVIY
ncbi:DUF5678 domain-containing protein [Argonema galeatum]|uniref:DUF5678 domain-containing protein n=1 Tax=Argonema galeatum TaxID=2942762 RepID=UPI00201372E9|nr:DUF5678 domain-containing protein [Argonema galeatum]MCL1465633.1 DUF5678 domain-containing protein [Argonema galeatum A003/A1]